MATAVALAVRVMNARTLAASDPLASTGESGPEASGPLGPLLLAGLERLPEAVGPMGGALLLDALGCGVAAVVAARLLGPAVGMITGLLLAGYAPLLALATPGSPAPPTLLAVAILLGLVTPSNLPDATGRTRVRGVRFAGAGVVAALVVGFQPGWLVGLPLILLAPRVRRDPARGIRTLALTGGVAVGLAGVVLTAGRGPAALVHEPVPGALTPVAAERGMPAHSLAEGALAWRDPGETFAVLPQRISYLLNQIELSSSRRFDYQAAHSPWLVWAIGLGLLMPLALVGMARPPEPEIRAVHLVLAASLLPVLLLPVGALLRVPTLVPLAIFAATGIVTAATVVRDNQGEAFIAVLLLFGAGWVFTHLPVDESRATRDWVAAAELLLDRDRPLEAEEALDRARWIDPRHPEIYEAYVRVYRATDRPQEAASAEVQARVMRRVREAREAREGGGG